MKCGTEGGLLVGAHVDSTKGVVEELKGQPRKTALEHLDCLEISAAQTKDPEKTIDYIRQTLGYERPIVFGSDSHNPFKAANTMWVKMARPDFNGLSQILFEPDLRISTAEPLPPSHPRITGCATTHGVYASEMFAFSANLNVVIGGKGAGKSALIDLLRFAFEVEPADPDERRTFAKRIADFLQGVGDVLVSVVSQDREEYVIVRSGAFDPDKKLGPQFTESAEVFQIGSGSALLRELHPKDVLSVEFYGQGEVANLTKRIDEQLQLIDENLDLTSLKAKAQNLVADIEEREDELAKKLDEITKLNEEVQELPELLERKSYLDKRLTEPVFEQHERWTKEQVLFKAVESTADAIKSRVNVSLDNVQLPEVNMATTPNPDLVKQAASEVRELFDAAKSGLSETKKSVAARTQTIAKLKADWEQNFKKHREEFRKELAVLGLPNLAAIAAERAEKQKQVEEIEQVTVPKRDRLKDEVEELRTKRIEILTELRAAREEIEAQRKGLVENLNDELGGIVRIEFEPGGDGSAYADYVSQSLEGSGMQNRQEQVAGVCEQLSPAELADALQKGEAAVLSEKGKLTASNTTILQRVFSEREIMVIEHLDTPSLPNIKLRREGEATFSELDNLSVGEQCSAILSIALLNKARPLVIDQPEDELDHGFITQSIVESIRRVKGKRQIIAATHNPNIPVLGDAEQIFRVAKRSAGPVCEIRVAGGIEIPKVIGEVQMLEGGPEAFERRRQKYEGRVQAR